MAEEKLDLKAFLAKLDSAANTLKLDFSVPSKLHEDAKSNVGDRLNNQIPIHRTILLGLIITLTILSFLLLAGVIVFQMWKRIENPSYNGVSDTVVNILAVGVFAELVGVIGIIVRFVWREPK